MSRDSRFNRLLDQIRQETDPQGISRPCHYCGIPANTLDHVVPQMMLRMIEQSDDEALKTQIKERHRVLLVSACSECNNLLGSHYFPTLAKRKEWVKHKLRNRYRKFLSMPNWKPEELAEVDGILQDFILQSLTIKRHIERRLAA